MSGLKPGLIQVMLWGLLLVNSVQAEITVADGYVRGLPPGQPTTAAFMRLINSGDSAVTIARVLTDSAETAEFHAHQHRDGLMRMTPVEHITIPAGGEFVLAPGDHHLMLIDLLKPLREGDQVTITLQSVQGEAVRAVLPVRSVLNEHRH